MVFAAVRYSHVDMARRVTGSLAIRFCQHLCAIFGDLLQADDVNI
jgi:hypothetical protein